jgi:hypothetical protein
MRRGAEFEGTASDYINIFIAKVICNIVKEHSIPIFIFVNLRPCGLVVRAPSYTTQMYCDSCEVRTEFIYVLWKKVDRLCGLVVRVPGYTTQMYCDSCEVRTEFIYVMWKKVDRLCGLVVRVPGYRFRGPSSIPGATRFSGK